MGKRQPGRFDFKQFSIQQDDRVMKVGTDSVLLGAWTAVEGRNRILDVGTGSGIIALMLAQRSSPQTLIHAIDIQEDSCRLAKKNFDSSPWLTKISVSRSSLQDFDPGHKFDLIISNPPFFRNSLRPPDAQRAIARHAVTIGHAELLEHGVRLLAQDGIICLILPASDFQRQLSTAGGLGLHPVRTCIVSTKKDKPPGRILVELGRQKKQPATGSIVLLEQDGSRSPEYKALSREFYVGGEPP